MKTSAVTFATAEGRGEFPFEMLAYDMCWPSTADDMRKILPRYAYDPKETLGRRTIRLGFARRPTVDRWGSFNWTLRLDEDAQ